MTADDVGNPHNDDPVAKDIILYVFGGPLSGGGTLYYHCVGEGNQVTVTAAPNQPAGVTYSWSTTGPVAIASSSGGSATVRATDPPVGVCQGTVTCTYSLGGHSCTADLDVPVRKPYRLVEGTGSYAPKHVQFNNERVDKGDTCLVRVGPWQPDTLIWGWVVDVCYGVLDQCGSLMDDVAGMTADEAWSGDWSPGEEGPTDVANGYLCDCVAIGNDEGPVTGYDPSKSATQTWRIWGCLVRTNNWTIGNEDGSYTSSGP